MNNYSTKIATGEGTLSLTADSDGEARTPSLSVARFAARREAGERSQLIDVRSPGEFATGHIPGAVNIPMEEIEGRAAAAHGPGDLRPDEPVILVCKSGRRAAMTEELLRASHPALSLAVLEGGTDAWVRAGLPVVRSSAARWSLERQVRVGAGLLVLAGTILSLTVAPAWLYLAMFVGAGLTFAGLTNVCGMALLLAKMPWNRAKPVRCGV